MGGVFSAILYSTKILQVFNFVNFQPLAKLIQRKSLTPEPQFSSSDCKSVNGQHPRAMVLNPQGTLSKEMLC